MAVRIVQGLVDSAGALSKAAENNATSSRALQRLAGQAAGSTALSNDATVSKLRVSVSRPGAQERERVRDPKEAEEVARGVSAQIRSDDEEAREAHNIGTSEVKSHFSA